MNNDFNENDNDVRDTRSCAEGRPAQTNVAGHALDSTFCSICDKAPCNKETEYWGVCPVCHADPHWLNIGADHWCYCPEHQVKWAVGANLFSSWMYETEEEQKAKCDALNFGSFTVVDEVPRPHSEYTPEQREADQASDGLSIDELENL